MNLINNNFIIEFNKFLSEQVVFYSEDNILNKSIKYSLLSAGKRIRPILISALLSSLGHDFKIGLNYSLAIEMIHTYSLIHDDLPSMDNDDYRRGIESNHKKYGEAIATLAGDSLNTDAFFFLSDCSYEDSIKIKLINLLSKSSGSKGMIKGQSLDIIFEGVDTSQEMIDEIHNLKTSELISASIKGALILIDKEIYNNEFNEISKILGLIYQIKNDLSISNNDYNSDISNNKSTYLKKNGVKESNEIIDKLYKKLLLILDNVKMINDDFINVIKYIVNN